MDSGTQSSAGTNLLDDNLSILGLKIYAKKFQFRGENVGLNSPKLCLGSEISQTFDIAPKCIQKLTSQPKNSEIVDEILCSERFPNICGTEKLIVLHTAEELSFQDASPENCFSSFQDHLNTNFNLVDREFQEDGRYSAVNEDRLYSTGETAHCVNPRERRENRVTKSIDDINKFRYVQVQPTSANSSRKDKDFRVKCTLPVPLMGNKCNAQGAVLKSIDCVNKFRYLRPTGANSSRKDKDSGVKCMLPVLLLRNYSNAQDAEPNCLLSTSNDEITVLGVLRELAKDHHFDPDLSKLSAFP